MKTETLEGCCTVCGRATAAESLRDANEATHTPTPWKVGHETGITRTDVHGWGYIAVMDRGTPEDAAFIVRAVNSHEALLEAAKWALATMKNHNTSVKVALEKAIARAEKGS